MSRSPYEFMIVPCMPMMADVASGMVPKPTEFQEWRDKRRNKIRRDDDPLNPANPHGTYAWFQTLPVARQLVAMGRAPSSTGHPVVVLPLPNSSGVELVISSDKLIAADLTWLLISGDLLVAFNADGTRFSIVERAVAS